LAIAWPANKIIENEVEEIVHSAEIVVVGEEEENTNENDK